MLDITEDAGEGAIGQSPALRRPSGRFGRYPSSSGMVVCDPMGALGSVRRRADRAE
jgi:hypothetical protein